MYLFECHADRRVAHIFGLVLTGAQTLPVPPATHPRSSNVHLH